MRQKPFDEYRHGEVFESHSRTITETDLVNFTCFAGLKLPIFIDEEFCREKSAFGTRVAPGFMTCAIAAGMMDDIVGPYTVANLALDDFRFKGPVKPGDTIRIRMTVLEMRVTSDPSRGTLKYETAVLNQRGETVLTFLSTNLMRRSLE